MCARCATILKSLKKYASFANDLCQEGSGSELTFLWKIPCQSAIRYIDSPSIIFFKKRKVRINKRPHTYKLHYLLQCSAKVLWEAIVFQHIRALDLIHVKVIKQTIFIRIRAPPKCGRNGIVCSSKFNIYLEIFINLYWCAFSTLPNAPRGNLAVIKTKEFSTRWTKFQSAAGLSGSDSPLSKKF